MCSGGVGGGCLAFCCSAHLKGEHATCACACMIVQGCYYLFICAVKDEHSDQLKENIPFTCFVFCVSLFLQLRNGIIDLLFSLSFNRGPGGHNTFI